MFERLGEMRRHASYFLPRTSGVVDAGSATGLVVFLSGLTEEGTIPIIHDPGQIGATAFSLIGLSWLAHSNRKPPKQLRVDK